MAGSGPHVVCSRSGDSGGIDKNEIFFNDSSLTREASACDGRVIDLSLISNRKTIGTIKKTKIKYKEI